MNNQAFDIDQEVDLKDLIYQIILYQIFLIQKAEVKLSVEIIFFKHDFAKPFYN